MLAGEAYERMREVVGEENLSTDPAVLDTYAYQPFHKAEPGSWIPRPGAVVLPADTGEVQEVVKICHEYGIRFKAHSTGWGAMGGPGVEGVLQIDLRRMNRILEIDEKNMIAVVEPYVICAQLQAELMKRGLNLHIIGAGSGTSPLASCTSHMGMGWSGISMGYNGRNLLGVEWVLPDGNILRVGTAGSRTGWFCGDGPGPSLRGALRGWAGADGGFGVFTRISLKLYPWPGPPQPDIGGLLLGLDAEVPGNFKSYLLLLPDYRAWADAAYRIGEAEIGYVMGKNAIGLMMWIMSPRFMRVVGDKPNLKAMLRAFQHSMWVILAGHSLEETGYQRKVLERIAAELEGVLIDTAGLPGLESSVWWGFVRAALPPLIFRGGGNFFTSFGGDEAVDNTILQAERGERIKREFIDRGYLLEDFADNMWGGIYEYGLINHQEELALFETRDPVQFEHVEEYGDACARAVLENNLAGPGFALFLGNRAHQRFGPAMSDYHIWLRRLKTEFDPQDLSDSTYFISPEDGGGEQGQGG